MNKQYLVTVIVPSTTFEFKVSAKSKEEAYSKIETEWDKEHGKGDLDKQTVGIHG
jgi:hypothetical protein